MTGKSGQSLKMLIVADGRSAITRRWFEMLQPLGHEITLASTFASEPVEGVRETCIIPVAFSQFGGSQAGNASPRKQKGLVSRFRGLAAALRHQLGPWTISSATPAFLDLIARIQPDVVHALRIPYEGMLASATPAGIPLVVSTWGNDLTLHAPATRKMGDLTRKVLRRADALLSDAQRDRKLALEWGLDSQKPALVVPGNGGIDLQEILATAAGIEKQDQPQVINPRGLRSYVRNDTFFKAIPLVLQQYPQVQFICTSMAGQPEALKWVERLGLGGNVSLLPLLSKHDLWRQFALSTLSVSVSTHDGTPNSLLEAMCLGCLPVCGDLESIREWITPGVNGLLVDPGDHRSLADAIIRGLEDKALQSSAAQLNLELVRQRAEVSAVREGVSEFFTRLTGK